LWWRAWTGGAASTVRCGCLDPGQQVWFVAWPAFALSHGLNLFFTNWLWSGPGVNLLANASSPLVGVVLAPVTWVFGPFVATTVALTLAPGLSAWGGWLAARRVVDWRPACWVAGFLFGYSPFVVQNVDQGHLGLGLPVFPPLIFVVLHEILVRRQRSATWCGVALGLLLFLQFMVSQEILTLTVITAVVGIAASALVSPRRAAEAFPFALRAFGTAAAVSVATLAAPASFMLEGPQHIKGSIWAGAQVLFTSAAYGIWNAGHVAVPLASFPAGTGVGPPVQFLGIAVLAAAAVSLALAWRTRTLWVLAIVVVVTTICSWGSVLYLSPTHVEFGKWLVWQWFTNRPILDNVESVHFVALADLAVALIIALGIGAARSWPLWGRMPAGARVLGLVALGAVIAAMVVPIWSSYRAPLVVQRVRLPPWYTTAAREVPPGSVIASYPFPASAAAESQPMVWQAADGMRFRLAGGYVKVPGRARGVIGTGPQGSATWTLDTLTLASGQAQVQFTLTGGDVARLRSALRRWDVSYVVVTDTGSAPVEAAAVFTATTGTVPVVAHRAWVWDLRTRPLLSHLDSTLAASAFQSCRSSAPTLGRVPSARALPQTLNRCVAAGTRS
jgi:dolichyl-phosphate beta-glucosyltransferase